MVCGEATILIGDAGSPRRAILLACVGAGAVAAALLLASQLPQPRTLTTFRIAAYSAGAIFFLLVSATITAMLPLGRVRGRWIAVLVAALFALVVVLNLAQVPVASDIAKIAFGASAGIGLLQLIERPWWLVPVSVCVPIADAWSVFSERGVTNEVVERAQEDRAWIDWPTVATPIAGLPYEAFGRLGIVDFLFLALFLAAAQRWDLGLVRCALILPFAFVGTNVLVLESVTSAVPALPLLCIAFLLLCAPGLWRDLRAAMAGR